MSTTPGCAWRKSIDELGKPDRAAALRDKAAALFRHFNEAFWDEESGFYAYMLDGEKRKVLTVASNPGHLLWSGIVPPDRAARVVARLMAPDMNSGWGIRTLSALHPAFNPYSYQNGSVWPHDNSLIALGFKRYGFAREVGADRPRHLRRRQPFPAQPAAGTLCRRAARRDRVPGAISRRQRAAGLGRRFGVRAVAGDPRHPPGCAARTDLRRSRAARMAAGHHAASTFVSAGAASTSASGARTTRRASRCCAARRTSWNSGPSIRSRPEGGTASCSTCEPPMR